MKVIVTGSAGFIGAHVCASLGNKKNIKVIGIDNFNTYYDIGLKEARVVALAPDIEHYRIDISDFGATRELIFSFKPDIIIHLAAQAGVRHSFQAPLDYINSNIDGQMSILEAIREYGELKRLIYASSSSVYGGIDETPFKEEMHLKTPKSLYAATKIVDEVMTSTYSQLYGIDAIGLRFFTVYGPWGRPDMAYWKFADSILEKRDISLFNFGKIKRDFTYIDDIVSSIIRMVDEVTETAIINSQHRVYNIGNQTPIAVSSMIEILSEKLGQTTNIKLEPLPAGDVVETFAEVERLRRDYNFSPNTTLNDGLDKFVNWFLEWRAIKK
jgi:UDP-glucuronate 4-epimerase